jgi:hypothetical protein
MGNTVTDLRMERKEARRQLQFRLLVLDKISEYSCSEEGITKVFEFDSLKLALSNLFPSDEVSLCGNLHSAFIINETISVYLGCGSGKVKLRICTVANVEGKNEIHIDYEEVSV